MTSLNTWAGRTVLNWRWWVVLPFIPAFILIVLMYSALETAEEYITAIMAWKRAGDRA